MKSLKALSALLTYPHEDLIAALPEIRTLLDSDPLLRAGEKRGLQALADHLEATDLFDLQEGYGLMFDRTRALSLHLFEHVHGESRDRGQAMVDLIRVYEEGGYTPTIEELPDYLPLFLEYASTRPPQEAIELIGQPAHVLSALAERLAKRNSPYEAIFRSLLSLSRAKPDREALEALLAEPEHEPDDLEALDAAWEEEEVKFGPGAATSDACGHEGLIAKVRQARRPAPGLETAAKAGPRTTFAHTSAKI